MPINYTSGLADGKKHYVSVTVLSPTNQTLPDMELKPTLEKMKALGATPEDRVEAPAPAPTPAETPAPAPEPAQQTVSNQTGFISLLNTRVTALRFFESGSDLTPFSQRTYNNSFDKSKTRYIGWELDLEHPAPGSRLYFDIVAIWYRPDGEEYARQTLHSYVEANWANSQHALGWGSPDAGSVFSYGDYRVDLLVQGEKIASGTFHIFLT
jgi:hypothetical protein